MRICLDFDNTIHDSRHPLAGRKMGPPMVGAVKAVWQLKAWGNTLVIHTSRVQETKQAAHVEAWLRFYGFPPIPVSVPKPVADCYVDDRGLRFTSWDAVMPVLAHPLGSASA